MYRYIKLLTVLLFAGSFTLNAQISNQRKTMSQGVYDAVVLSIPTLERKEVANLWTDFTKDFYDARSKYDRKTKEYFADDAEIGAIGQGHPLDIYASVEENGEGVVLTMWIDLGGAYLSPSAHPEQYLEAEKMMERFKMETDKRRIELEIEAQEKMLSDLENDLKKLGNDKERAERDIEKAQETIREAEADIKINNDNQALKNEEIEKQKALIEATRQRLNDL